MAAIEDQRVFEQFTEVVVGFLLFRRRFYIFRDVHARPRGKFIERFLEIKVLALHDELKDIAAFIALTEAAPGAALRPDDERGRVLVVMERTKTRIVLARMAQFDTGLRDQICNIYFRF